MQEKKEKKYKIVIKTERGKLKTKRGKVKRVLKN